MESMPMSTIVIAIAGLVGLVLAIALITNYGGSGSILANAIVAEEQKIMNILSSLSLSIQTPIPGFEIPVK